MPEKVHSTKRANWAAKESKKPEKFFGCSSSLKLCLQLVETKEKKRDGVDGGEIEDNYLFEKWKVEEGHRRELRIMN